MLAAVAAKGVKELTYHRDYAGRWFLTLAQGTEESRRRLLAALDQLWPLLAELLATHPVEAAAGRGRRRGRPGRRVADEVDVVLDQVLAVERRRAARPPRRSAASAAAPAATGCTPRR